MAGMKINQRQMQQAMRQMGIKNEVIPNVTEVIIRTTEKEIVISPASVNVMIMKGQKSFQVDGLDTERPLGAQSAPAAPYTPEDIDLVMQQTGCDKDKAVAALEATGGDLAEAILKVMGE